MARTILITGATRGLGRALTERFIDAGHTLVGCGRSRKLVETMRNAFPSPHQFEALDVTDDAAVAKWAKALAQSGVVPDLLINNAAVINTPKPLWEVSADEFRQVIEVNIIGVTNVIRHFVPAMIAQKRGVIVNLSSGWGRSTSPEVAPYCASKYAIEGLTLALAQELPSGMAAVPLNPGIIDTDMLRSAWGEGASRYPSATEWSRAVAPWLLKLGPQDNGQSLTAPA